MITITKKNLKGQLKSKYFIVTLSSEENLNKCINNNIAGFPETDNGMWAYLDINNGDYISFFYNGRIFNLYKVAKKFIPNAFHNKKGIGSSKYDPVPLSPNGNQWKAIHTRKNKNIYFPYRLSLDPINKLKFATSVIFKNGLERLGINLIPRAGLKKSHFQLSIKDIKKIFGKKISVNAISKSFNLNDFVEIAQRIRIPNNIPISTISDLTTKEIFLQALIKRILEASIKQYANNVLNINNIDDLEFFSEQAVYGGEADIVISNSSGNIAFVEVKNNSVLNKDKILTAKGKQARNQVINYKDIVHPCKRILKIVTGRRSLKNKNAVIEIIKNCDIYIIEINDKLKILRNGNTYTI